MKLVQLLLCLSIYSLSAFAVNTPDAAVEETDPKYQEVIDEYKKYLDSVPAEVRKEIEEYRIKIFEINKDKKELYKKLSQEAQGYLKTEQKLKKKLPIKLRKEVAKEATKDTTEQKH
jgi:hypothetical protein